MDYTMEFTFDPDSPLSWEQQMDKQFPLLMQKKIAQEKIERGRLQVRHGQLLADTVKSFLAVLTPEKAKQIEKRIQKLQTIKGEKKFKAETIRMLMEMYLLGLCQAYFQREDVGKALKLDGARKEKGKPQS